MGGYNLWTMVDNVTSHTHEAEGEVETYTHSHADPECTHHWATCPVHAVEGGMPSFKVAVTCVYGGAELKDGGTWDAETSNDVVERMAARL